MLPWRRDTTYTASGREERTSTLSVLEHRQSHGIFYVCRVAVFCGLLHCLSRHSCEIAGLAVRSLERLPSLDNPAGDREFNSQRFFCPKCYG